MGNKLRFTDYNGTNFDAEAIELFFWFWFCFFPFWKTPKALTLDYNKEFSLDLIVSFFNVNNLSNPQIGSYATLYGYLSIITE